jgi:hypothetical protein
LLSRKPNNYDPAVTAQLLDQTLCKAGTASRIEEED